jgi:hypothetical protein
MEIVGILDTQMKSQYCMQKCTHVRCSEVNIVKMVVFRRQEA